jgi:hypothetical protein
VWKASNGRWVYDNSSIWHFDQVSSGEVYAQYNESETFTVNVAGTYTITVEVYSYGLRKYFTQDLLMWANGYKTSYCRFG